MKWYGKVALASVALMIVGFGGVKLYNTYFQKEEKYVVQKEEKHDIEAFGLEQQQGELNKKQESKGKEEDARKEKFGVKDEAASLGKSTKKDGIESMPNTSKKKTSQSRGQNGKAGEVYSAYDANPAITVIEGDGSSYLTNKSKGVLVKVEYTGEGDKTIKIGDDEERVVSQSNPYQYVLRVADNVAVVAKAGSSQNSKTINNMVTVTTGCEVSGTTGYVKDKTYHSAILGGKIAGSVAMSGTNIKELGVRYWRGDVEDEIYTVKTQTITTHTSAGQKVSIGTNSVTYELLAMSLKENTIYYMQSYMVNAVGEVLLGDVKEFSTLGHGVGLYGLYYGGNDDETPKLIKQETENKMTIAVPGGYKKAKWAGEIAPLNSGLMTFKVTSSGSVSIKIGDETLACSSGSAVKTSNIYNIGKKYPITIEAQSVAGTTVKVEWKEDNAYQEIHKEQLYPKEYVKMASAVVNSKGTDNQEINKTTGKVMKKKVITNGQNITKFELTYDSNNVATTAKINGSTSYTITGTSATGELVGWLVYNTNGVIEPLNENVATIDYTANTVTLRNGSVWSLYNDVEVVGRLMQLSDRKVYDLGRYIDSSTGKLTDGKSLGSDDLYRADNVDNTYILNLYSRETSPYQQALEQYSTMERFVEDAKSVDKWNLAIGEARLYSIVPLRIVLSFDADENFSIKNPVIRINKDLFKDKACSDKDGVFKLSLPTDASGNEITSLYYGDWRYMNKSVGDYNREATSVTSTTGGTVTIKEDGDHFDIKLNDYTASGNVIDNVGKNNIMLNVLLRVDSIDQKTSDEVFNGISASEKERAGYNLNGSYRTYTNVKVSNLNSNGTQTDISEIPVEIKIKPQVTFE